MQGTQFTQNVPEGNKNLRSDERGDAQYEERPDRPTSGDADNPQQKADNTGKQAKKPRSR